MTRIKDVAFGIFIGGVGMGAIVALANAPSLDPVKVSPQYYKV